MLFGRSKKRVASLTKCLRNDPALVEMFLQLSRSSKPTNMKTPESSWVLRNLRHDRRVSDSRLRRFVYRFIAAHAEASKGDLLEELKSHKQERSGHEFVDLNLNRNNIAYHRDASGSAKVSASEHRSKLRSPDEYGFEPPQHLPATTNLVTISPVNSKFRDVFHRISQGVPNEFGNELAGLIQRRPNSGFSALTKSLIAAASIEYFASYTARPGTVLGPVVLWGTSEADFNTIRGAGPSHWLRALGMAQSLARRDNDVVLLLKTSAHEASTVARPTTLDAGNYAAHHHTRSRDLPAAGGKTVSFSDGQTPVSEYIYPQKAIRASNILDMVEYSDDTVGSTLSLIDAKQQHQNWRRSNNS